MAKQKIKFGAPDIHNAIMPSITELITWLPGLADYPALLWSAQKKLGLVRPSLNTIKASFNGGVTPRSAEQIEINIEKLVEHYGVTAFADRILSEAPLIFGPNGVRWVAFSQGVMEGLKRHELFKNIEANHTLTFLEHRAKAEKQWISRVRKANEIDLHNNGMGVHLSETMSSVLSQNVLIEADDLGLYCDAIVALYKKRKLASLEEFSSALRAGFRLRVDFYYQLFANFIMDMVGNYDLSDLPEELVKTIVEQGAFSELVPTIRHGQLNTPTAHLYRLWSKVFGSEARPMSYRKMATHIPSPLPSRTRGAGGGSTADMREVVWETKRGRFAEWRNGTVPNTEQLIRFLESLAGSHRAVLLPFLMARVSTIWTAWIKQERKQLDDLVWAVPELADYLKFEDYIQYFSRYPIYWQTAKARAGI